MVADFGMAQIGPQLPPGFKPKRQTESESDKSSSSGSESEDDVFGPKPVAPDQAGTSTAASAAEAIEKRQLAMRKKLEDDQAVKPEAREEWMLELPDEKRGLLGLGPRKFKTKNFTAGGDRSIWTDTPVDRARKAEEAESGPAKPKPMNPEDLAAAARDRKLEKIAAKLKEGRAESLLEMHRRGAEFPDLAKKDQEEEATKKRKRDSATDSSSSSSSSDTESEGESSKMKRKEKKKRKKEKKKLKKLKKALAKEAAKKEAKKKEKEKKKEGEKPERIPFDRDKDFNIAKINVSARDSMIKKAGKLNSNFYTGKQKFL